MLKFKAIQLDNTALNKEVYMTSSTADRLVDYVVNRYSITENLYTDGRRHIGTEFSKIYKALYPICLKSEEMVYLQLTDEVIDKLGNEKISWVGKKLETKAEGPAYTQLVSLKMVSIYLGKLRLSDTVIDELLTNIRVVNLKVPNSLCVLGNKPVKIEGKPLVRLLTTITADKDIQNHKVIVNTGDGVKISIPASYSMQYVKAGTLLRKDIYVAIKALAASQEKNMYEVVEDLLLGKGINLKNMLIN